MKNDILKNFEEREEIISLYKNIKISDYNDDFVTEFKDYSINCIEGIYKGNSLYINRNKKGEIIGSSKNEEITLYLNSEFVDDFQFNIFFKKNNYFLKNLGKKNYLYFNRKNVLHCNCYKENYFCDFCLKNYVDFMSFVEEIVFKYDNIKYKIIIKKIEKKQNLKNFEKKNYLKNDLEKVDLGHIYEEVKKLGIKEISNFNNLTLKELKFLGLTFREIEKIDIFLNSSQKLKISLINFDKKKIIDSLLVKKEDKKINLENLSKIFTDFYLIKKHDKYFIKMKKEKKNFFFQLPKKILIKLNPEDLIATEDNIFKIEKFSLGIQQNIGSKKNLEDRYIIDQNIFVRNNSKIQFSFFGIFDG